MNLKELLGTVAPVIASALGTPLAGVAVKAACEALGLSAHTEDALSTALSGAKPEDLLKLKQADQQFQKDMKALDIDLERINAGDRDSARKREAAVGDKTTRNLAYLIVLGGGVMIGCTSAGFTKVDSVLAGTLIGYAVSEMKQVLTYYFGSSAGSKEKDNTLAEIAKQP